MKLINKELEKRVNAILFFKAKVKYPFALKIFKLLFFLDFSHFKKYGRTVTDLEYFTFKKGPVPKIFWEQIKNDDLPDEIKKSMEIVVVKDALTEDYIFTQFIAKKKYNLDAFSESEIEILNDLATIYKEAKAEDMSEVTHLKNSPWEKTLKTKGIYMKIDFLLAIDSEAEVDEEEAIQMMEEIGEIKRTFS